jgi:hypothetical protein
MKRQPTAEEVSGMTRREMKRYCKTFKLSRKGKNYVLIERLTRYLRERAPTPVEEIIQEKPPSPFVLSNFCHHLTRPF